MSISVEQDLAAMDDEGAPAPSVPEEETTHDNVYIVVGVGESIEILMLLIRCSPIHSSLLHYRKCMYYIY